MLKTTEVVWWFIGSLHYSRILHMFEIFHHKVFLLISPGPFTLINYLEHSVTPGSQARKSLYLPGKASKESKEGSATGHPFFPYCPTLNLRLSTLSTWTCSDLLLYMWALNPRLNSVWADTSVLSQRNSQQPRLKRGMCFSPGPWGGLNLLVLYPCSCPSKENLIPKLPLLKGFCKLGSFFS